MNLQLSPRGGIQTASLDRWRAEGADDEVAGWCLLSGRLDELIEEKRSLHKHVLIASMPKSASTYLNAVLSEATGFQSYLLNTIGNDTERNIDPTSIPMFLCRDTISQEHMRATQENLRLLELMRIKPVVLVRNIFDTVISTCDHGIPVSGGSGPSAHVPREYVNWSREDQLWFIIRMGVPWLLTLTTSWLDAGAKLEPLWITYEDVVRETEATLRRVLDHCEIEVEGDAVCEAIERVEKKDVRFNQGVAGRGEAELSASQQDAIREIASTYRGVYDLSLIGL